ncbi:MAG TPA: SAM-dependent chlorinase/fluorinase, partial [Acidimicrobiales bacterium]
VPAEVTEGVAGEVAPDAGTVDPVLFFLSDYGTADEFVGVVHAVLHHRAPGVPVIDLSHHVPPFDVAAGSALLVRAGPHLGAGVVLAVVDPGVATDRRAVALEPASGRPRWLVGPDNGLLLALAAASGGVRTAVALDPARLGPAVRPGTFDGRDVFAPAAAHLVTGGAAGEIGTPIDPAALVELAVGGTEGTGHGIGPGGPPEPEVVSSVTWIDRFGNAQLSVGPAALTGIGLTVGGRALVTVEDRAPADRGAEVVRGRPSVSGRWVTAFGQLGEGELGVMEDANGQMSLVLDRASAAEALGLGRPGGTVRIVGGEGGARA